MSDDPMLRSGWDDLLLAMGSRVRIEASAGTGKTWTISVLYVRLLLERGLRPGQILVATFSEAAAQELHERLRLRLIWAERAAAEYAATRSGPVGAGSDAAYLASRWQGGHCDRDRLQLRLALAELDTAPIGTLHSICRRILGDHPLACAMPFEPAALISSQAMNEEMHADLRRQLAQSSAELDAGDARWLHDLGQFERALAAIADPDLVIAGPAAVDLAALMDPAQGRMLRAFCDEAQWFTRSNSAYRSALYRIADYIEAGNPQAEFERAERVADSALEGHVKPALIERALQHPAVQFAARFARELPQYDAGVRAESLLRHRQQLIQWREQRLLERGQFTFDSLIERVHHALHSGDSRLADQLHGDWPVALIDEFQDTNAAQFAILDRIYRAHDGSARGLLVMIGDPKQAIYAFRGGDIHTYQRAAAEAGEAMYLDVNHRSSAHYMQGLNSFYALVAPGLTRVGNTLGFDYQVVRENPRAAADGYSIAGVPESRPLQFHMLDAPPAAKGLRTRTALLACARQIAGMLQSGRHQIGSLRLRPGDIAVLLPRNDHIVMLRGFLQQLAVPCAGAGQQSVFHTEWAAELQIILYALAHPRQAAAMRAALATRLIGFELDQIIALDRAPAAWQSALELMHELQETWRRRGVLALVQHLLQRAPPALRVPSQFERNVTDLRHLGELLDEAAQTHRGIEQLLAWLNRQRGDSDAAPEAAEEQQLRIESDAARVRLLTLHASKGLEFGIVFLPLMWAHERSLRQRPPYPIVFDRASGRRLVDLGTPEQPTRRAQADADDQDERFRVLYVALTRARHACHVYVLPPSRPRDARVTVALADPERSALDALVERVLQRLERDPQALAAMPGLAWHDDNWAWPDIRYSVDEDARDGHATPQIPELPDPRPPRSVHSFSNLLRPARSNGIEEAPALDELVPVEGDQLAQAGEISDVLSVPERAPHPQLILLDEVRGAALGNALHSALEQRQIGQPMRAQQALLAAALRQYDVRSSRCSQDEFVALWAERLDQALAADLGDGLRIDQLSAQAQRAEIEFHFAVDQVRLAQLRTICAEHGDADLIPVALGVAQLNGLLTGKIDLVVQQGMRFHLLDWKGNALSNHLNDYTGDALVAAMDTHHYRLQSLIYTLAVDRMLAARIAGYQRALHLGSAIYLFVRAAGLAPAAGVWRHRFDDALIDALQQALATPGTAA